MRKTRNIKGIIYRIFNSRATDKIIHLINTKGSKEAMLAKGARKPTSRKSSAIEIGNLINAKIVDGYSLPILQDIKIDNEYKHWKDSIEGITSIQFIFEILGHFCYEESEENELFRDLQETLESNNKDYFFILSILLLKVLESTGHSPSVIQGESEAEYDERLLKTQKFILKTNIYNALRVNLSLEEKKKMLKLHVEWVEQIIERELKSKPILYNILKI